MATAPTLDLVTGDIASNDVVAAVTQNPGIVLLDRQKFDAFYARMKSETDKLVPDTSTAKGRDEIRSMAARVRSSKAAIDKARLTLTKEWRDKTSMANEAGKTIETELETLAIEVRKPLTEWEEAEKARAAEIDRMIADIDIAAIIAPDDTAATVRDRGAMVWGIATTEAQFGDRVKEAKDTKDRAVGVLKAALARLVQEDADRAELAKLRAEREEAERIAAEKAAAEEAERQRVEVERIAEECRIAAEKAEAERIERAQQEAAARAQREAEEAAQAERDRIQRQHNEALAVERRRAEQAEADASAERARAEQRAAAEAAEAKRIADEQAAREANKAHRTRVKTAAKQAIMTCGVSEDAAQKVVLAIIAKEIPNVRLEY